MDRLLKRKSVSVFKFRKNGLNVETKKGSGVNWSLSISVSDKIDNRHMKKILDSFDKLVSSFDSDVNISIGHQYLSLELLDDNFISIYRKILDDNDISLGSKVASISSINHYFEFPPEGWILDYIKSVPTIESRKDCEILEMIHFLIPGLVAEKGRSSNSPLSYNKYIQTFDTKSKFECVFNYMLYLSYALTEEKYQEFLDNNTTLEIMSKVSSDRSTSTLDKSLKMYENFEETSRLLKVLNYDQFMYFTENLEIPRNLYEFQLSRTITGVQPASIFNNNKRSSLLFTGRRPVYEESKDLYRTSIRVFEDFLSESEINYIFKNSSQICKTMSEENIQFVRDIVPYLAFIFAESGLSYAEEFCSYAVNESTDRNKHMRFNRWLSSESFIEDYRKTRSKELCNYPFEWAITMIDE